MDSGPPDAGTDAGPMFPDGGDVPLGALRIEELCDPTFAACGGTITDGTYYVQDVCIDWRRLVGILATGCDGYLVENVTANYSLGTVIFEGANVTRDTLAHFEADLNFPSMSCARLPICSMANMVLPRIYDRVSCSNNDDMSRCICHVEFNQRVMETDSFTTDPTQITFDPSGDIHAYCVEGDGLRHGDLAMTASADPSIFTLTPLP